MYENLFAQDESDSASLYPLLIAGAVMMRDKLCTYAQDQFPGGKCWDPAEAVVRYSETFNESGDENILVAENLDI